ncbi:MAG: serine protease [Planctomycetaceae bacterium]|nr:serine protease [Planctomycetaceae bacterium]
MLRMLAILGCAVLMISISTTIRAQSVCLPAPRLLTMMPMGGQVGSTVEVTITGDHIEEADQLIFSCPGITATSKLDAQGLPIPNRYVVSISADCPTGIHEARVMTRLGVSTSRVFNVGALEETIQVKPNTSLDTAMALKTDSVCNAVITPKSVDHYSFEAEQGERVVVDCAAGGIDSKLTPVLIIADAQGADLRVERRGGAIDFEAPQSGQYIIKVHDLTFNGGSAYFYRLVVDRSEKNEVIPRLPSVKGVNAFSWPPPSLTDDHLLSEQEPNNQPSQAQKITLPCDITGSFYPAADIDSFEFTAKKGEVWWVEVGSERLGRPTDPSIVVQHIAGPGSEEKRTIVAELTDIASPVKVSSNGYSYDGPPYNAGSSDLIGKLEIQQDGVHRLQLRDLFGGTRNDPRNTYRLIIRKAAPDFALVGWALHMNLRNGDRNALSKPIALRGGATMPIEVVVVRRDGFDGEIELSMENLPEGVSATGLKIPAGQSRGIMLVSADENAPRGFSSVSFTGRATIDGKVVTRPCRMASMQWPVPNAWSEIPSPRLLADVPVSVCGSELAPLSITPAEDKIWEASAGEKLSIPLALTRRIEFSGKSISLKTFGTGFEKTPAFDASLSEDTSEAVLDLAALKTPPGDYVIAFYGSAVAKYRDNPEAVTIAKLALDRAKQNVMELEAKAESLDKATASVPDEKALESKQAAQDVAEQLKSAKAAVTAAEQRLKAATSRAQPKDIVDIISSTPIKVRIKPAEQK